MKDKALILDIQRMSTEDGPGLRTTVFFKGCGLSCAWCHNPESIKNIIEVQWVETRCIGCRSCSNICKNGGLDFTESGIKIDRAKCKSCLNCVNICPSGALEAKGKYCNLNDLYNEVIKDETYFKKSGGGVTASGGEALLQADFLGEFFKKLKEKGINTALDTAGFVNKESIEEVLPFTDLVLYDIKIFDSEKHKKYTGSGNKKILENLLYIAAYMRKKSVKGLWIRTPVIPGSTADEENIIAIGNFIADNLLDVTERWELCAFNNLCRDKYKRLGIEWLYKDTDLMKKNQMENLENAAKTTGAKNIVMWSGATKIDE